MRKEKEDLKREIAEIDQEIEDLNLGTVIGNGMFHFDISKQKEIHGQLLKDFLDNFEEALSLEKGYWEIEKIIESKNIGQSENFGNDLKIKSQLKKSLDTNTKQRNVLLDLMNRIFDGMVYEIISLKKYSKMVKLDKLSKGNGKFE